MRIYTLTAAVGLASMSLAGTLTTELPNNGSGGIFMDLTALTQPLNVTSFETYFGTAGTNVSIQVYTRAGSYVGNTGSNAGWTLSETASALSNGTAGLATMNLTNAISLGSNQTTGVYLHSITTGQGIRYTGTSGTPPQTTWTNADLTLFSANSRTGAVAFGGTEFSPRTFAGKVNYDVVPEPATITALAIGAAAMLRRRRK